jgi:hypothetical protein
MNKEVARIGRKIEEITDSLHLHLIYAANVVRSGAECRLLYAHFLQSWFDGEKPHRGRPELLA